MVISFTLSFVLVTMALDMSISVTTWLNHALVSVTYEFYFVFPRGQESAGIVTSTGNDKYTVHSHKGMGMVSHVFKDEATIAKLQGNLGIGLLNMSFL